MDSFDQASDRKCPKLVTKNTRMIQKLSLLAAQLRQSLTLAVLKVKVNMEYQPILLFIQLKTVSSLCHNELDTRHSYHISFGFW